ncbi:hypothetical protein AYI69_g4397 [Smittium culicis]|uniref:Uncharacterized protein n=1 Tax=Smittium culicis TaxID=133412 RepID=A0A1R1YDW9_9FUNG|nr:hypothetical protein AYI69_g4397 [Smittium culicis]
MSPMSIRSKEPKDLATVAKTSTYMWEIISRSGTFPIMFFLLIIFTFIFKSHYNLSSNGLSDAANGLT